MSKHMNLQPWIDYFRMLRTYEEKGFLEVLPEKHEAFITRAALLTLANCTADDDERKLAIGIHGVVHRIHVYVNYLTAAAEGRKDYEEAMRKAPDGPASDHPVWMTEEIQKRTRAVVEKVEKLYFALHVVKEEPPHDLLNTLLLTKKRTARSLWLQDTDHIEVIDYSEKNFKL